VGKDPFRFRLPHARPATPNNLAEGTGLRGKRLQDRSAHVLELVHRQAAGDLADRSDVHLDDLDCDVERLVLDPPRGRRFAGPKVLGKQCC
jgi:hypothetical protein